MPLRTTSALLIFAAILPVPALANVHAANRSCNPNGNTFNLAPTVNGSLQGQANESVALLLGGGDNGNDLVLGGALDYRQLIFDSGFPNDVFYVERDNASCAADFEGGLPGITVSLFGTFVSIVGYPQALADPIHDAFFMADVRTNGEQLGIGIVRAAAANFLNANNCPSGTQVDTALCWQTGSVANLAAVNTELFNPSIAVDQRNSGTGAGDVYLAVAQQNNDTNAQPQIALSACTNVLDCGQPVIISGSDTDALYPQVQVRSDGGISISYANVVIKNFLIASYEMKFVSCTPNGAPNPPTCNSPILVTNETHPGVTVPGDGLSSTDVAFPRHINRLESDGKTITTFLIYDQCAVAIFELRGANDGQVCPKTQVVVASSTDDGNTWSAIVPVSPNTPGQQFLGNIALDQSTGTVNIAYYSSQNDPLNLRTQVYLAQILPGQTTVSKFNQITATLYDGPTGFNLFNGDPVSCCDYIGVAAAGTGQSGQSHVYIHFTGAADGKLNGQGFPIYTNTLTEFEY
jgi:hypothetical protein